MCLFLCYMSNFHLFLSDISLFCLVKDCVLCTCPSVSQRYARRPSTVALAWDYRAGASTSAHRACVRCLCLTATFSCLTLWCFCLTAMCSEPQDRGTCSDYSVKWFYNSTESRCTRFWYGGCGGNGNRFDSEEQCKMGCVDVTGPGESRVSESAVMKASGCCVCVCLYMCVCVCVCIRACVCVRVCVHAQEDKFPCKLVLGQ